MLARAALFDATKQKESGTMLCKVVVNHSILQFPCCIILCVLAFELREIRKGVVGVNSNGHNIFFDLFGVVFLVKTSEVSIALVFDW